jgi:hypothetical protein
MLNINIKEHIRKKFMRGMKASTKHKGCVTTTSFDYVFGSQKIHSFNYEIAKSKTRGVSQCGIAIYIKKKYLKAKEELWKFKYFHHAKM